MASIIRARRCFSLIDLPPDMIIDILIRLGQQCVPSLLNAKATCSFVRQLEEDRLVLRSLSTPQIPLLIEEKNFAVQRLLDRCNDCGNLHAKFRLAMLHFFCKEKNFMFGYALLDWLASRGLRRDIYMWVLLTLILGVKGEPQMEARMFHSWGKIWEERKIFGIRESLESWFPILHLRHKRYRGEFHLVDFRACKQHASPTMWKLYVPSTNAGHQSSVVCQGCRIDFEVRWFVEKFGRLYIAP